MPYPNEHACRLKDPDGFQPKSFRRYTERQPKGQTLIIARPKGKTTTATQAIRYAKTVWTAERARASCEDKKGTFEPAIKENELPSEEYLEAKWQDIVSLEEGDMQEAIFSFNDRRDILGTAVQAKFGKSTDKYSIWIRDVWEADLVYEDANTRKFYKASYTIDANGKVTLGDPKQVIVQTTYEELSEAATIKARVQGFLKQADSLLGAKDMPDAVKAHVKVMRTALHKSWDDLQSDGDDGAEEAMEQEISGDFLELIEALKEDIVNLKIIQPGWGSSGYYSQEVLKRDAPVYRAGTQMFWDHPTLTEEKDRPERSVRDLAGVLISDGQFDSGGSAGPGVYAQARVFGGYKEVLAELAPHIGISHRAMGKAKKGEAEGQKGDIIEQITTARSVDFVTVPGAGGKVLQLFEAAKGRGAQQQVETIRKEEQDMTDEEKAILEQKVQDAEKERDDLKAENERLGTENARMSEGLLYLAAAAIVTTELKETQLPDLTRQRLTETLAKNPPVKEGKLDEEALKATIKERMDEELKYLAEVTGSGLIKGLGGSRESTISIEQALKDAYLRDGKSEEEAEKLARLGAEGR